MTEHAPHEESLKSLPDRFTVEGHTARCDGGGGALGHPAVYLEIGASGDVTCPYCSRVYVTTPSKHL